MFYIDDKPTWHVDSVYEDDIKGCLEINFYKKAPFVSWWRKHTVSVYFICGDEEKKVAEFITRGAKRWKNTLYLKILNEYMRKSYV